MAIEERAKAVINKRYGGFDLELKRWATECCVEIAAEQDLISRKEERERCIKEALKACCESCKYTCFKDHCRCATYNNIRKAIEEGE